MNRESHAKRFLAGLILSLAAGTATIWFFTGFTLAVAYASGGGTVLLFAKVAPSYPDVADTEDTTERGVH